MYSASYFAAVALFGVFALWLAARARRGDRRRADLRWIGGLALALAAAAVSYLFDTDRRDAATTAPSGPGSISAPATVSDGDSLRIGELRIRLVDIDAPELDQCCKNEAGQLIRCGDIARRHLQSLVAGREVACSWAGSDPNGRPLATCYAGSVNINARMVRDGYAILYHRRQGASSWSPSWRYAAEHTEARKARRGLHSYQVIEPPHVLRANQRQRLAPALKGC